MEIRQAGQEDFDAAFALIQALWSYRTYDREEVRGLYHRILRQEDSFFFLLSENGMDYGMCQGTVFDTFWMSGPTCYVSGLYVTPELQGRGFGTQLLNRTRELAKARGCRAIILDSGLPREQAHQFYEHYGFEKSCYGFEYLL